MEYRFEATHTDYSDFATGRVIYNRPGLTAFPVRLISEMFQRCAQMLREEGVSEPFTVYDPCCGGGYILTVLGFMYSQQIGKLMGSDPDRSALEIAFKNLSLLTPAGMQSRKDELRTLYQSFGKESHAIALDSADRLIERLSGTSADSALFESNALTARLGDPLWMYPKCDIVMFDIPYDDQTQWMLPEGFTMDDDPVNRLLTNLMPVLHDHGKVVVFSTKTKFRHEGMRRLSKFTIGKRMVTMLQKA